VYGDGSLYTTYRNVRLPPPVPVGTHADITNITKFYTFPFSASDTQRSGCSWMLPCRVGRGTPKPWPPGDPRDFFRQADVIVLPVVTLFNDLPRETMGPFSALTGVFLFGSTTARSSGGLLGWNCGYAFCSNVSTISLLRTRGDWWLMVIGLVRLCMGFCMRSRRRYFLPKIEEPGMG